LAFEAHVFGSENLGSDTVQWSVVKKKSAYSSSHIVYGVVTLNLHGN